MESAGPKANNASSMVGSFDQLSLEGSPSLPLSSTGSKSDCRNNVSYLGHPWVGQGWGPAPLNIYKTFKKGNPCAYLRYDKEIDSMILEQTVIPKSPILVSHRENGRLRMCFDRDEDEEKEEEKAVVTQDK